MRQFLPVPVILAVIILTSFILTDIYHDIRDQTLDNYHRRQLLLARQASLGISKHVNEYQTDLTFLAQLQSVIKGNKRGLNLLDTYVRNRGDDIINIALMNSSGTLTYIYPEKEFIGSDISYQSHVKRLLETKKPVLSEVFDSVEGYRAVSYHVPLFTSGKFTGSLSVLIPFNRVAERFLGDLKTCPGGYAWMISRGGTVLYHPDKNEVGRNILHGMDKHAGLPDLFQRMIGGEEGKATYVYYAREEDNSREESKHASFTPVPVANTHWSIAVVTPESEILKELTGFRNRFIIIMALSIIGLALLSGLLSRNIWLLREENRLRELASELSRSREQLHLIIENSPAGIGVMDDTGNTRLINRRFTELFGYTISDIPDLEAWSRQAYPDSDYRNIKRQQWYEKTKDLDPGKGYSISESVRIQTRDGNFRIVDIITGRMEDGVIGLFNDRTDEIDAARKKKELEQQLSRARKMESLGLLAGGVAHDLNNILLGIVTYPDMILRQLPDDSPLRRPMETIQQAGSRAAAIVSDLLTLTRGAARRESRLDLGNCIREFSTSPEARELFKQIPEVAFTMDLAERELPLTGSRVHILKSIFNLVSNGYEAIEGEGKVHLETDYRKLTAELEAYERIPPGEYVLLSIHDTGPGIPLETLDRIFEPFYTRKVMGRSGSGLGLSVVWNTMRDHNGFIDIRSDSSGTSFHLYFPMAPLGKPSIEEDNPSEIPEGSNETILVVDDDPVQRDVAVNILNELGYEVKACEKGEEAVEYVKEKSVDLVILDMILEESIDGKETYRRILDVRPGTRAIIVSGYALNEDAKETLEMGASLFLGKPYSVSEIGQAVHKALSMKTHQE